MTRRSLSRRILAWLGSYVLLITIGVFLLGWYVNEYAEDLLWDSFVRAEFDYYQDRRASDPAYHWIDTDSRKLYIEGSAQPPPTEFGHLPEGVHDEVLLHDGTQVLVLVRLVDGVRHALALDITELERQEDRLILLMLLCAAAMAVLIGAVMAFGVNRALRPLSDMARAIAALSPAHGRQRIVTGQHASSELLVIANALNDYLDRNERFVERERGFINSASHELRTPVAVIAGAAELALEPSASLAATRHQMQRILRTTADMEQLIALLLALAKEPARVAQANEKIALHELLPDIVEQHRHLLRDKALELAIAPLPPCEIEAPVGIVRAAIGNLLRNAIENSDSGCIHIRLETPATIVIEDPGHGMTPEQISAIYARMARGGTQEGGGIGLPLIMRLCEHLGWRLELSSDPSYGTTAVLRLK
ncbi:MAG: HAMP domain-containing sensor histidine kinase [Lysobacteraceae bacterium]